MSSTAKISEKNPRHKFMLNQLIENEEKSAYKRSVSKYVLNGYNIYESIDPM